jgi:hypothetical protein
MNLKCLFGHKWNDCKCERCGETRDEEHKWIILKGKCIEKCSMCGKERGIEHKWNHCKCEICGTTRDEEHNYVFINETCIVKCSICGKEREMHTYNFRGLGYKCTKCGALKQFKSVEEYIAVCILGVKLKFEDKNIPFTVCAQECSRHAWAVKIVMYVSSCGNRPYEDAKEDLLSLPGSKYAYEELKSLGPHAYFTTLAMFDNSTNLINAYQEYVKNGIKGNKVYEGLIEETIKRYYNSNLGINSSSEAYMFSEFN